MSPSDFPMVSDSKHEAAKYTESFVVIRWKAYKESAGTSKIALRQTANLLQRRVAAAGRLNFVRQINDHVQRHHTPLLRRL